MALLPAQKPELRPSKRAEQSRTEQSRAESEQLAGNIFYSPAHQLLSDRPRDDNSPFSLGGERRAKPIKSIIEGARQHSKTGHDTSYYNLSVY